MDHDWRQIYLYITTRTYRKWGKNEMPGDIAVDPISNYQMGELNRLKEWLYCKRTQVRQIGGGQSEDRSGKRRQRKERRSSQHYLNSRITW